MFDLRSFVPSLCEAMQVPLPALAQQPGYFTTPSSKPLQRALIYCPDAFGLHALKWQPDLHKRIAERTTIQVDLQAAFPPVTPVCFASLFTGGAPQEHGIQKYEKPVLSCDTVFDAFLRAGKKVALIAVENCSVDRIFRNRKLDYFPCAYDPLVTAETLKVMSRNEHDLIICYHQEYDDLLHATTPFSNLALKALHHHVESFELLLEAAESVWKQDYLVGFTPDHGAHIDAKTQQGDHGEDREEDMQLKHFFFVKSSQ